MYLYVVAIGFSPQGLLNTMTHCMPYSFKAQVTPSQVTFCVRIYNYVYNYVTVSMYSNTHMHQQVLFTLLLLLNQLRPLTS